MSFTIFLILSIYSYIACVGFIAYATQELTVSDLILCIFGILLMPIVVMITIIVALYYITRFAASHVLKISEKWDEKIIWQKKSVD